MCAPGEDGSAGASDIAVARMLAAVIAVGLVVWGFAGVGLATVLGWVR